MTDRKEFIEAYVAVFLASLAAARYRDLAVAIDRERDWLKGQPPVEDARHFAEEAWQRLQEEEEHP